MKYSIIFVIMCCLLTTPAISAEKQWGPWDWKVDYSPVCPIKPENPYSTSIVEGSPLKVIAIGTVRFYQQYLSKTRQTRCPMYPTCSRFATLSLRKYGPLWGTLMVTDRIYFRENSNMHQFYELYEVDGMFQYYDPPENNYIFSDENNIKTLP